MTRDAWDRFWFAGVSSENLSRIRILFGVIFTMKLLGLSSLARWGQHTLHAPVYLQTRFIPGQFTLPFPGFDWLPMPSLVVAYWLDWGLLVLVAMFAVGLFARWVGPLIVAVQVYAMLLTQFGYTHHVSVLMWISIVLCLSPCSDHYSFDAWRRVGPAPKRPITSLRMLQVLTATVYFSTTFGKLNGGWVDGQMMTMMVDEGHLTGPATPWVIAVVSPAFLGFLTLFVEGFLVFALWFPATRRLGIWLGVLFHLGIDTMMPVTTFSYQMWLLYISFIDPTPGQTRVSVPSGHWLLTLGRWLDIFKRVTWTTGGSSLVLESPHGRLEGSGAWLELGSLSPFTFLFAWPFAAAFRRYRRA